MKNKKWLGLVPLNAKKWYYLILTIVALLIITIKVTLFKKKYLIRKSRRE